MRHTSMPSVGGHSFYDRFFYIFFLVSLCRNGTRYRSLDALKLKGLQGISKSASVISERSTEMTLAKGGRMMEVKNKHKKYEAYKTFKQLLAEKRIPAGDDKGIELWSNQNCSHHYHYYDSTRALPCTRLYYWETLSLRTKSTVEVALSDPYGHVVFKSLVRPSTYSLRSIDGVAQDWYEYGSSRSQDGELFGYSRADFLTAPSWTTVEARIFKLLKDLEVKEVMEYAASLALPDGLDVKQYSIMDRFSKMVHIEPDDWIYDYYDAEFEEGEDQYKWQPYARCAEFFGHRTDDVPRIAPAYAQNLALVGEDSFDWQKLPLKERTKQVEDYREMYGS